MANETATTAPSAAAAPVADAPVSATATADTLPSPALSTMGAGDIPSPAPMATAEPIPLPPVEAAPVAPMPDPLADVLARLEAQEKRNADLHAQLAKLTAEPPKPVAPKEPRTLTDSPYEAQARDYYGELPKPLLTQATQVLEKRHAWQQELRAAEAASKTGDAAAVNRVAEAQKWLGTIQNSLERIEFDAQMSRQLQAQQAPAAQAWNVTAREALIDDAISDRANWGEAYKGLADHEVASVLRAVPAGASPEDYTARAMHALTTYAASRQPAKPVAPQVVASPKNLAPAAPAKAATDAAAPFWPTDRILTEEERDNMLFARSRGDAPTTN